MQGVSALPKAMSEHLDTAKPKAASQLLIYKNLAILRSAGGFSVTCNPKDFNEQWTWVRESQIFILMTKTHKAEQKLQLKNLGVGCGLGNMGTGCLESLGCFLES